MKATLTAVMLAVLVAAAGEIRINSLDVEADRAVSVTGPQSNQLARAAAAAGYAYSPTNPPPAAGNVVSVNGATGVVSVTLAQAAAAGGFAGTETIAPVRVAARAFGVDAGLDAAGDEWIAVGLSAGRGAYGGDWGAFGVSAGQNATGEGWGAYGNSAGLAAYGNGWGAFGVAAGWEASGNRWGAFGVGAGYTATGDNWGAYGASAGRVSVHTNSHSFGHYAGNNARGNNRLYADTYAADPLYPENGATNDMIFGDAGYLHLGRGAGAPGGAQGGTLRGPWRTDAGLSVTGSFTVNGEPVGQCPVWQSCGLLPAAGGTQYPTLSQMALSLANTATNLWLVIQHPAPQSHVVIQLQTYGTSVAAGTNPVSVAIKTGGYGDLAVGSPTVRTVICNGSEASGRYTNIVYVAPSATPTYGGAFLRFDLTRPNTMASGSAVTFVIPFWRCATSNEILTKTFAP